MPARQYGQFCGLARALEIVGERWALLIVRDLLVGPRRFTDLQRGLPGIPTNILTCRLKELEQTGIVQRRILPRPSSSVVYELTEYGAELEDAVIELGRWGAKSMGDPRPEEIVTADSLVMALRSTFHAEAALGRPQGFELHFGEIVIGARVSDGALEVTVGPLPGADLTIEAGPVIKALMSREITPAEAIANGSVRCTGDPALLDRFVEIFALEALPAGSAAGLKSSS
ncbi:MAG: helix-turn-helix domain-containing protein [Candidatus Elarobacter sp.]